MLKMIKTHYYWIVAAILLLLMAIRGGTGNNLPGLHIVQVTEALNISRAEFSLATSASSVVMMMSVLMISAVAKRVDYRYVMAFFIGVGALAYVVMEQANSYGVFFTGYLLLGFCHGFCGEAGTTRMVSAWFHKHRGTVLGLVMSATGSGASITCIFQAAAIQRGGYQMSFRLVAIMMGVCAVLAFLLLRGEPGKIGLKPYGEGQQVVDRKSVQALWCGLPMKKLVRRPTFYMMLFGTLITCTLSNLALPVVVPHLQDRNLDFAQASQLQSVLMLCLAASKILAGYLCDKIGAKKTAMLCLALDAAALALLATASGFVSAAVAVVVFAMALPITTVIVPLLASTLFGYRAQGNYTGIFISMVSASAILANPIANIVYDHTGTYQHLFLIASGLMVIMMGAYLLMYRLADKDRAKLEAEESAI